MQRKNRTLTLSNLIILSVVLFSISVQAEQSNNQNWRELAQKEKLSENAIEKLAENNVAITDTAYKQIFTPYIGGVDINNELSLFITTDSLINAYHVLYEESILRLENANANRLEEILKFVLSNLNKAQGNIKGKPELVKAAHQRALIVVGTAMKLLDENYKINDKDIDKIANEEVEKIKKATANEKPSWLGEPTSDLLKIDYSRYKPKSFYTSSEKLSKYFRAVSWLQSIPFRLDKDDELLSMLMLGNCLNSNQLGEDSKKYQKYIDFFSSFKMLIGSGDDWDVITAMNQIDGNLSDNDLSNIREKLEQKLKDEGGSLINDHVRFPPISNSAAAEPQFRFISAYRTPDSVMFHRTTDIREFSRDFPNGLEVCAALDSEFAKSKLEYSDKAKLLKTIKDTKEAFSGDSLYLDYLQCLACLLDETPAQSPSFMESQAWQAKSCNTTLAGWSQLRHTWSLQAKQNAMAGGGFRMPAGFVEPEPDFYHSMALLAKKTSEVLGRVGAFDANYAEISNSIMFFVKFAENKTSRELHEAFGDLTNKQHQNVILGETLASFAGIPYPYRGDGYTSEDLSKIEKIAQDLLLGKLPVNESMKIWILREYNDIESLWKSLESMSRKLEEISRKQLAGEDIDEYRQFMVGYGVELAHIMMYNGNSYLSPNDDSTRIVDVYSNAFVDDKQYLHAGIGRARAIYVLYPWQDDLVLCRGAVIPYYEFKSDSRLTDSEWKNLLDSPQKPDLPDWIKPVISDNK